MIRQPGRGLESLESVWNTYAGDADRVARFRQIAELLGHTPDAIEAFLEEPAHAEEDPDAE